MPENGASVGPCSEDGSDAEEGTGTGSGNEISEGGGDVGVVMGRGVSGKGKSVVVEAGGAGVVWGSSAGDGDCAGGIGRVSAGAGRDTPGDGMLVGSAPDGRASGEGKLIGEIG